MGSLVDPKTAVLVQCEKPLRLNSRRYVPDLVVRCAKSDRIMLVVEVWHTHAVTARKKAAFTAAGFPWIEVRSWHVISRFRKRPLPVLDWAARAFQRARNSSGSLTPSRPVLRSDPGKLNSARECILGIHA